MKSRLRGEAPNNNLIDYCTKTIRLFLFLFLVPLLLSDIGYAASDIVNDADKCGPSFAKFVDQTGADNSIADLLEYIDLRRAQNKPVVLDIGGEGRYQDAINLNPQNLTTTTGTSGRPIPLWLKGVGQSIPLPDNSVDTVYLENTPLFKDTLKEILRVIRPRGNIHLFHPKSYSDKILKMVETLFLEAEISVQTFGNHDSLATRRISISMPLGIGSLRVSGE